MSRRRRDPPAREPGQDAARGASPALRRALALGAAGLALGAAGCAEPPALDLMLVPDPNVNTTEQLLAHVQQAVLVVDAEEGLYAPGEERSRGGVQVKNADVDAALELVFTLSIERERLPIIRIEQGGLPDVSLNIRVLGLQASPAPGSFVARGELMGARLAAPPPMMTVPFNLRPEVRPLRVERVLPDDGDVALGCAVPSLVISFSRPIDEASLRAPGAVAITPDPGPISVAMDPSGLVANVATPRLAGVGRLAYRVTIASAVRDPTGQPLDQVAAEAGAQGYLGDFSLSCESPPIVPTEPPCAPDYDCPRGAACVGGVCLPRDCPVPCPGGRVCDRLRALCVDDCRADALFSPCAPEHRCDAASGLCR